MSKKGRGQYTKYSDSDGFRIGKYASENGSRKAAKHFSKEFSINESTARSMKEKYENHIKLAAKEKRDATPTLQVARQGRPLLLGEELDAKVLSYLKAVRSRGGNVSKEIAHATAEALIQKDPEYNHIDIRESHWAQSLFRRMGFKRQAATTGKVAVPPSLLEEIELTYLHSMFHKIEKYKIPSSMILNLDQTPLKYAPMSKYTMAKAGAKGIPLAGSDDKRVITGTFAIDLTGTFLPMQLIYGGKTSKSLPRVKFPESFCLSVNEKHYSNERESLRYFDEVIIPYLESERVRLNLPNQYGLVVMDVFRGQMTDKVLGHLLADNFVFHEKVPANMTRQGTFSL